jgi:hypothetical protein
MDTGFLEECLIIIFYSLEGTFKHVFLLTVNSYTDGYANIEIFYERDKTITWVCWVVGKIYGCDISEDGIAIK